MKTQPRPLETLVPGRVSPRRAPDQLRGPVPPAQARTALIEERESLTVRLRETAAAVAELYTAATEKGADGPATDGVGISLGRDEVKNAKGKKVSVVRVKGMEGGGAALESEKLRVGDIILDVDGKPLAGL